MSLKIDTKNFKKTRDELVKLNNNLDNIFKQAINEIAMRMFRAVVKKPPVDTGFLRDSWTVGAIIKKGSVYEVQITNVADYAQYIEYGHRIVVNDATVGWVDGFFILTTTEANIKKVMDRIIEKRFEEAFKKVW